MTKWAAIWKRAAKKWRRGARIYEGQLELTLEIQELYQGWVNGFIDKQKGRERWATVWKQAAKDWRARSKAQSQFNQVAFGRMRKAMEAAAILKSDIDAIKDLAVDALYTDGAHHKQWFIERIMEQAGIDLDEFADNMQKWERGIAP